MIVCLLLLVHAGRKTGKPYPAVAECQRQHPWRSRLATRIMGRLCCLRRSICQPQPGSSRVSDSCSRRCRKRRSLSVRARLRASR